MKKPRRIVVEALIPESVSEVWRRTQDPREHVRWDIRFTHIEYLDATDSRGFRLLDYRTDVALGIEVQGRGHYLHTEPLAHSTFEFDSDDWKSIIRNGRGVWQYEERPQGTYFRTVYDYDSRYGFVGRFLDRVFFRRLLQLATEWGFETLRLWCAGDESVLETRRRRSRFLLFFMRRSLGWPPAAGAARSHIGSGRAVDRVDLRRESELKGSP